MQLHDCKTTLSNELLLLDIVEVLDEQLGLLGYLDLQCLVVQEHPVHQPHGSQHSFDCLELAVSIVDRDIVLVLNPLPGDYRSTVLY